MHANHEVWDTIYLNIKSIKVINLLAYEQELSNDASLVILPWLVAAICSLFEKVCIKHENIDDYRVAPKYI